MQIHNVDIIKYVLLFLSAVYIAMLGIFTRRCREINIYCRGIAQQALSGFGFEAFGRVVVKNVLLQVEGCQHIISIFKTNKAVSLSNVKTVRMLGISEFHGARRAMMSSVSSSQLQSRDSTLQVPGSSDRQFLLTLFWSTMVVRHLRRHATGLLPAAIVTIAFVAMVGQPKPSGRERSISDFWLYHDACPQKKASQAFQIPQKKKQFVWYNRRKGLFH